VEQYLGTSSEAEAKRIRHAVVAEILASFERAREGGPIRSDELKGTSKNDVVGVKLDVLRGLPDRGQA
jgi:hypothetical protein